MMDMVELRKAREPGRGSKGGPALILIGDSLTKRAEHITERVLALGYDVVTVDTAQDATRLVAEKKPDLVIVAARLCDGTGADLCREIKSASSQTPVIIIADRNDDDAMLAGQTAGADEFLTIPSAPGEISLRIRRVLGLRFMRPIGTDGDQRSAADGQSSPAASNGSKRRILVAEDDDDLRKIMTQLLSKSGYDVKCVSDGEVAMLAVAAFGPELAILDVKMPKITGIDVCRTIKDDPATRMIPVLIVTGVDPAQGAREAYQAGADDYLVKPVNPVELLVRIRTILRIQELRTSSAKNKSSGDKDVKSVVEPLDPLSAWFRWHELWTRSPDVANIRERVSSVIGAYLEGLHEFKPDLFTDPKMPAEKIRQAYGEIQSLITARIEKFFWEEPGFAKTPLPTDSREMLIRELLHNRFAFGPIQPLIDDPRITDILVNRFNEIHIELGGNLIRTPIRFNDEGHLRQIMTVVLRYAGKEVNESRPFVETRLRDGSRVSATVPPLSIDGATLTIRKFVVRRMALSDLLRSGMLSPEMASMLNLFVKAGLNIIVSGATGSGKTTLLNLLGSCIPLNERIITVEDTAELQIRQRDVIPDLMGRASNKDVPAQNMERFEARSSMIDNLKITIRDIIRLALRKRPDRIIVGEVRGGEALDMLNAMNTGHRGCLTTIHANNTTDMIVRLENMILEANPALPMAAAQRIIVAALSLAIQVVKFANNKRRITEVTEIAAFDAGANQVRLSPIFTFRPDSTEPFVFSNLPSEKIHGLVEEFLIRTGRYKTDWDAPGSDQEALLAARKLTIRHVGVHFPGWIMKGASSEEKAAAAQETARALSNEIWSGRADMGYGDEEEHIFLLRLNREARIRAALRLGLPDELQQILSRDDPPGRETWERIFPVELRHAKRGELPHTRVWQAPPGEGLSADDVQMVLYSATAARKSGTSGDSAAVRAERIRALKILMPYLRLELDGSL